MSNSKILFFLIAFICGNTISQAQQYNFIKYTIQEGLPQSQVFAGIQDSKGYIWFGTQGGGVSRFDGIEFENFSTKVGLPSNYVNEIYEDKKGLIWIGTSKGLCYFNGKYIQEISFKKQKIEGIGALLQVTDSTLWIGSKNGIYEYSYPKKVIRKLKIHPKLDVFGINDFYWSKNGIWVASNGGAWLINEKVKRFIVKDGLLGNVIQSFSKSQNGNLWITAFNGGINVFDESKMKFVDLKSNPKIKKALCLYPNSDGNMWVGTRNNGVMIYNPLDSTWTQISEKQGLPHNHVRAIFKDNWDNVWICTSGGGVAKYMGQFFVHYNVSNGLQGKYIYALANDTSGHILISASNNGLSSFDGYGFQKFRRDSQYVDVKCKTILSTENGDVWLGTEGKGIVKIDSTGYQIFSEERGFSSNWIRSLIEDDEGNIWAATHTKGIVKIDELFTKKIVDSIEIDSIYYEFQTFSTKDGLPDQYVACLKKSNDGKIWFATRMGRLGYFENGELKRVYDYKNGLPDLAIRTIQFDENNYIWIGVGGGHGVYFASLDDDDLKFKPLESEQSLYSDNIYLLQFDPNGNLWAGSEIGVDKISFNDAGVVVTIQHFGRNEGFLGIETCQNSSIVDKEGNLWFGTMNGLTKHIPTQTLNTVSKPKIHFNEIALFYKPLSETDYKEFVLSEGGIKNGLKLPYHQNHLNFEFKAINQSTPKNIKYRWRLQGAEKKWSPFSKKESVDYSNIAPGKYHFEVQARSGESNLSDTIYADFEIKKPFWQLLWVQFLAGLLILLLLATIFYRWKKKLEIKEAEKREKLQVENHVLQLEQKALQLQINPHFIFNALNSIQSLVATKDFKTARTQINNFATLMRGILSNSKKQKISLSEEIIVLEKYLKMEQFCQRVPFQFDITCLDFDPDEVEIPPMILQPFVENSVIHGIAHLQKEGKIDINFSITYGLLTCEIIDNGVGRKRAEELRQSRKPGHQSIAMDVTRQRLNALKGNLNFVPLDTDDVLNDDGEVAGTKVVVKIPVQLNF